VTWTYWRVSPRIWYEPWSDDARLLSFYLLTCKHREAEGLFRLPKAYMHDDLKWSPERLAVALDELLRAGFVEYDEGASVILITKALKYQSPANPNQVKHAIGKLEDLPETALFAGLLRSAERYAKGFAERLREGLPTRFGNGSYATALPPAPTTAPTTAPKEPCPPEDPADVLCGELVTTASNNGDTFELFWAAYPRKETRPRAASLFAHLKPGEQVRALAAGRQYGAWAARHTDAELMLPSTFLSKTGRRWEEWADGPPLGRDRGSAPAQNSYQGERTAADREFFTNVPEAEEVAP